jgi:hypothetical protein
VSLLSSPNAAESPSETVAARGTGITKAAVSKLPDTS